MEIEFFPDIKLKRPLDLPLKRQHPDCRFLMDANDNYLFIFPDGDGFKLALCHRGDDDEETTQLGQWAVESKEKLEEVLNSNFIGFVDEDEYMKLYEIAGHASYDAASMLFKKFPDQGDFIRKTAMAHLHDSFDDLLSQDFFYLWTSEMDTLAPEDAKEWSNDYKETVANFYEEMYEEVYDAHCGVTRDRYDVIDRIEKLGYEFDDESNECIFNGAEGQVRFADFGEAERWVEEQEKNMQ